MHVQPDKVQIEMERKTELIPLPFRQGQGGGTIREDFPILEKKIYKKYHTALITLSSSELRRFGYQKGDTEGFVNLPLQISDVYYSVFMREDSDRIKLSFRSQGDRPVNILAHDIFNGGGHMNAAGGESFGTLDNTVKTFEDHFRDYFNK